MKKLAFLIAVAIVGFALALLGLMIVAGSVGGTTDATSCALSNTQKPSADDITATATTTTNADCGASATATLPSSPLVDNGLPSDYMIPADAAAPETVAITYALAQLGKPYLWGGVGPDAFDCSGLTMMAWAQAGVTLLHYTGDQINEGAPVSHYADISPGDLVLVPGSDGTVVNPGHVGLYIGDGLVESAVDVRYGVVVQPYTQFISGGLSAIRHVV